ncbi:hypothetical protein OESDEN_13854 [Oesophagostomum dentatum]|uniref:Uncharacterized protein n=1 Tax=Oesophagostomum dentatum TaxID=61180 RepID=A0A0B1ST51_OESDE|nr:hypothetical protein OESDEN_13854 [Oesophagostomum dentatum]
MRKKDKIVEDPLITSLLPPPEKTTLGPSATKKRGSGEEVKPLLAKANMETNSSQTKPAEGPSEDKSITRKRGSLVQEKLLKLNASVAKSENVATPVKHSQKELPAVPVAEKAEKEKPQEQKKAKVLPITTESKTTTTTMTSTSTKSKKASVEKKVQHISTGKKVEEVERKWTEQDNSVNVKKITSKQDSLDTPSTTTVKQNVTKQDSLRSTAEKERVEEETKDYAKTLRTARSALAKTVDKVTIEESSKLVVNPAESSNKDDSKTGVSLRSRSSSPTTKKQDQEPIKKKVKPADDEPKKHVDTKPPAPQKAVPKDSAAAPKAATKDTAAAPEKIPATITKSTSVKLREGKQDGEEANLKKKRATVASSSAHDTTTEFVPREDFSFDALKDKLIRRVTADQQQPPPKKECISITSVSSVRDRLRQFESKK